MDVGVRSAQQHQEERSVGVVSGKGSAAFRALHDDLPFGCTNAPFPRAATLFQQYFKDRQLMRHCDHSFGHLVIRRSIPLQVQRFTRNLRQIDNGGMMRLVPNTEPLLFWGPASSET
jgi:hypothetical protein